MIAVILLTLVGSLFAVMALAPLVIEESERAEATRRRPVPMPLPVRREKATDHEPVAA